ncbi:uncharacterized protein KZ484_009569 [Pholidichthys leucotaenia]
MQILLYLLLILTMDCDSDDQMFETETVLVGEDVTLKCDLGSQGTLFWIKLVSGKIPEILGKSSGDRVTYRLSVKTDSKSKVLALSIIKAKLSDTAVYYCVKTEQRNLAFLKGTNLKVGEPVTSTAPQSNPEPSVTFQHSVLPDSKNSTSPADGCTFCCGTESLKKCYFSHRNIEEEDCEKTLKAISRTTCLCSYFKNFNCSDAWKRYCAVFTTSDWKDRIINLLTAVLAVSLFVIAFLLYLIVKLKKKSRNSSKAAVSLQTDAPDTGIQENQETVEDALVYSAPTFISRKESKTVRKEVKPSEEESIYTEVKALVLD